MYTADLCREYHWGPGGEERKKTHTADRLCYTAARRHCMVCSMVGVAGGLTTPCPCQKHGGDGFPIFPRSEKSGSVQECCQGAGYRSPGVGRADDSEACPDTLA